MKTKARAIDDIVNAQKKNGIVVNRNPSYHLPKGCPRIDLEIITPNTRELYLILDLGKGKLRENDVLSGVRSLEYAGKIIRESGDCKEIKLFLDCINTTEQDLPPQLALLAAYESSGRYRRSEAAIPTR